MQRFHTLRIATVLLGLYAGACGDDDADNDGGSENTGKDAGKDAGGNAKDSGNGDGDAAAAATDGGTIELIGSWHGEYADEVIDKTTWAGAALIEFDNDENVAITQAPKDDEYNPNKFSKLVWTEPTKDGFHYCIVGFGADTLKDARAADMQADEDDLMTGCGDMNFAWTKLEPK